MCGIVAIYSYDNDAPGPSREELCVIRDAMRSRGPDAAGEWFSKDGRVALGHARLAIIDLSSAGSQPMVAAGESHCISFNGEIYNYREIRARLESRGRKFVTGTDTEVLLQLYEEVGEEMFSSLRGMYAFALWDNRKRCLLLA